MRLEDLDPAFEAACAAGWRPEEEEDMPHGTHESDLHEHRCSCGMYWSCRKTDCTPWDRCEECERDAYMDARDPQPELPLVMSGEEKSA